MEIRRVQGAFNWIILLSEASHVFCCVLPSLFSILSMMAGLGMIGVMPVWLISIHEMLHGWEVPMIAMSAAVLLLGWTLHYISYRMDCHSTGCVHEPCGPKKKNAAFILKVATILFLANILVYFVFHRGMDKDFRIHAREAHTGVHHDE
ncbi:MAG: hypothetical protein KDI13_10560 [Alphaproteobacteria bacterium]|nr:hypothetical protein [Alphaproteobacteria bacterium]